MTSALIEIRPSNETEESTSPERQCEHDTRYCEMRGWDIVHIAEDLDVFGGISPFERPELGPWLPGTVDGQGPLSSAAT
jgi:site-specific DNA recombinase